MSTTTDIGSPDTLDARLLVLDPDVEALFSEVEQILCEALHPVRVTGRSRGSVPGSPASRCPAVPVEPAWLSGRRPRTGRPTERAPPPHTGAYGFNRKEINQK
ncbi:hypothetical protein ACWDYH_28500 [Nocardia goodfellowii]